ncbi:MAG: DUF1573 domain-containing protein [Thermoguttaceae bacterium]|nr:DUF1573 domain-containing protein [Thermoguttaceae bacterium]MDW8039096.1 DUF1573 domain-containing protein [Thermoguttaceae bacterium]
MAKHCHFFRLLLGLLAGGCLQDVVICPYASAEQTTSGEQTPSGLPAGWADRLFEQKVYDFGRVPAKAHAEFDFQITNPYPFDVEISRVRYTCECTEPILQKASLAPGEQTHLTARLRTDRFQGRKGSTLTVTFIRPEFAEVQLHVTAYIDPGVSLHPPELDFGTLQPGQKALLQAEITCRDRPNWRIDSLRSPQPYIQATLTQIERSAAQVRYRLQVQMEATASIGPFKEVLWLQTNESQTAEIPVLITGRVAAELEVHPPVVWFGVMQPGQTVTKLLVLRSHRPFTIRSATTNLAGLSVQLPQTAQGQTLYRVTIRYRSPASAGKYKGLIRLQTDLGPQVLEIPVQAIVLAE